MLNKRFDRSVRPLFLVTVIMTFFFLFGRLAMAAISHSPSSPNVEQTVRFTLVPAPTASVFWTFGDGDTLTGGSTVNHAYKRVGTFAVVATYPGVRESGSVTIVERRFIEFTPLSPRPTEEIAFNARNFLSASVYWNFGDGTSFLGSPAAAHAYSSPGTYTVRAIDLGGKSTSPVTVSLNVGKTNPQIVYRPLSPKAGTPVEFTAVDFVSRTLIRWDFGDGVIVGDTTPPSITHIYGQPGTYLVRAYDNGSPVVSASRTIVVAPPPSISFSPGDPRPAEPVTLIAHYFDSATLIRWDFGDGSIENDPSPPSIVHAFANPGAYTVRAYDGGGTAPTAVIFIQVWPERLIIFSPQSPRVGESVSFQAVNFLSAAIVWDFGDGTPPAQAGQRISHAYQQEAAYTVVASDFRGAIPVPESVPLVVNPAQGPRALFSISYLQLRFDDGNNYRVVPLDSGPLVAYADLKYEGTGILYAQWTVDGMPYRLVSQSLPFAQQTVIDTGHIPGLPTLIPGIHEVRLDILEPRVEFAVPAIRYFVSVERGGRPLVALILSGATRLDRTEIPVLADSLEAPAGEYLLLQGAVINQSSSLIPHLLLRVFLGEKLIDQRIIKELKPDEKRPFESSVYNPDSEAKSVYLAVYDISEKTGLLLFIKEIKIRSPVKK